MKAKKPSTTAQYSGQQQSGIDKAKELPHNGKLLEAIISQRQTMLGICGLKES